MKMPRGLQCLWKEFSANLSKEHPRVKSTPRKGGTSKGLAEGGTVWIQCIVFWRFSLQFWGWNDKKRLQQGIRGSKELRKQSCPKHSCTKDDCKYPGEDVLGRRMWWVSEEVPGKMNAQKCRQQLVQNGHLWGQVWTWRTKQWDTVKSRPDLLTFFPNWTLKLCRLFIYLLLLAKFCPFDAICLVMTCPEAHLDWRVLYGKKWLQITLFVLHLNVNRTSTHTCLYLYISVYYISVYIWDPIFHPERWGVLHSSFRSVKCKPLISSKTSLPERRNHNEIIFSRTKSYWSTLVLDRYLK